MQFQRNNLDIKKVRIVRPILLYMGIHEVETKNNVEKGNYIQNTIQKIRTAYCRIIKLYESLFLEYTSLTYTVVLTLLIL